MQPLELVEVNCPYCGEIFATEVDCCLGENSFIIDCSVCCKPIYMQLIWDEQGELVGVEVKHENE